MTDRRNELMERARKIRFVPGHGPDLNKMTDDDLEKWIGIMESAFKLAFREKEE